MSCVQLSPTAGSEYARRLTNVPTLSAMTCIMALRIPAYVNYKDPFALEKTAPADYAFLESTGAGDLYIVTSIGSGTPIPLWADGRTTWQIIVLRANGATLRAAWLTPGASAFSGEVTDTFGGAPFVPTSLTIDGMVNFPTDDNGPVQHGFIKIWNAVLSDSQAIVESRSRKPRIWSDLTFWNPCLSATQFGTDFSGTGGALTVTGTPTIQDPDPGTAWQRAQVQL